MRLRTLPVSMAGVFAGTACALAAGNMRILPGIIALLFAIVAQIASNFANEYYDFRNGLDKKGREGFRRGVTEGDISPEAMKRATYALLLVDACLGLSLIPFGGWWLLIPGVLIFIFAMAYSTGPYPLSHHGLGDVAVVIFFGVVPVCLTAYVESGALRAMPDLPLSISTGLMAANVLIVNNYRDADDDRAVGKHTTVVLLGRRTMAGVYLCSGIAAAILGVWALWSYIPIAILVIGAIYLLLHISIWRRLVRSTGTALNPLLGKTAINLLIFALLTLAAVAVGFDCK